MTVHENIAEPWRVTVVDTGLNAQTGARVKRVQKYIGDEPFMLTYGDGVRTWIWLPCWNSTRHRARPSPLLASNQAGVRCAGIGR